MWCHTEYRMSRSGPRALFSFQRRRMAGPSKCRPQAAGASISGCLWDGVRPILRPRKPGGVRIYPPWAIYFPPIRRLERRPAKQVWTTNLTVNSIAGAERATEASTRSGWRLDWWTLRRRKRLMVTVPATKPRLAVRCPQRTRIERCTRSRTWQLSCQSCWCTAPTAS